MPSTEPPESDSAPAPAYRRRPEEKCERIQEAALRLFTEAGYDATSTAAIARAAGVSEGILFHHFGSKRELFQRLATDYAGECAAAVMPAELGENPPEAIARAVFRWLDRDEGRYRLFLRALPEPVPEGAESARDVVVAVIRANLERGIEQGRVRRGDLDVMAALQFAVLKGAYDAWRQQRRRARRETYIAEAIHSMNAMMAPGGETS